MSLIFDNSNDSISSLVGVVTISGSLSTQTITVNGNSINVPSSSGTFALLSDVANTSASLQTQITTNSTTISTIQTQIIQLSGFPIADIFRVEVASISSSLQTQATTNATNIASITGSYTSLSTTNDISASLQSQATTNANNILSLQSNVTSLSGRPIADIFRVEVASISGNLNTLILSYVPTEISLDFGTTPVYDKQFIITSPSVSLSSKILIHPSSSVPISGDSYTSDDYLFDAISFVPTVSSGAMMINAIATPGPIIGNRKIFVQVFN